MFSRWIAESGVSRGQSTSFRSSFSATDAARWIRFCIAPDAVVPSVDIEHGQITDPSTQAEPLAHGDDQPPGSQTDTASPAGTVLRASTAARGSRGNLKTPMPLTPRRARE